MQREAAACGQADAGRFWKVASRIAGSPAFLRLRRITFLGILSPAFKDLPGFPVTCRGQAASADGTRADHSFAVALLAHGIAVRLGLSGAAADHAAAWGLLHDIAAWPLSHTGEAAFSASTGTDARGLRRMMVLGSDSLPPELSLHASLKAAGIDHGTLLALFAKRADGLCQDLAELHRVIHSVLSPDALDGMHRTGRLVGVAVPSPWLFTGALERDPSAGTCLMPAASALAFRFWRAKAAIYADHINTPEAIGFESMWSRAIQDSFAHCGLVESLGLPEREIVRRAASAIGKCPSGLLRYKHPMRHVIAEAWRDRFEFARPMPLGALSEVFLSEPMALAAEAMPPAVLP